jgi:hypothetical protein
MRPALWKCRLTLPQPLNLATHAILRQDAPYFRASPLRVAVPGSSMLRRLDMLSSFQERDTLTARKCTLEIVVTSDTNLGTFECHAKELVECLDSIAPKTLVLNSDIIDLVVGNK